MVMGNHILFIVENNSVPHDRRVWNEALAVKELGYDVSIICPADRKQADNRNIIKGIRIYRHPRAPEGSGKWAVLAEYINATCWELLLSIRVFMFHPFKVIHAANPPDHIFLIALPFKIAGVKFVFDHHDLMPETYIAKYGAKGIVHRILLWMERLSFWAADIVISTNESYKKIAIERGSRAEKDVIVVRNGPNLSNIPEVKPNPHLLAGFRYLIGYHGIIGQQECMENLLQAANYVVKDLHRDDIKFAIVGSGPHLSNVIRMSKDMGLENYVQFFGYVPDHTLYEILKTSDICVNPEFRNEFTNKSTMIKVMEYMTFRKPIVQFYTLEGHFTAGESAVYIRANDVKQFARAILELLEDPVRRDKLGRIGRKRIEESLNWDIQKHNLKTVYQRILPVV